MARLGNGVADCQEDPSGLVRITNFDMGRHQVRGDAVQAPDWLCHGTLQVRLGLCWWERWFLSHIHWWICSGPWPPRIIDPPSPGGRKAGGKLREILRGYIEYNLRYCRGSFENTLENPVWGEIERIPRIERYLSQIWEFWYFGNIGFEKMQLSDHWALSENWGQIEWNLRFLMFFMFSINGPLWSCLRLHWG